MSKTLRIVSLLLALLMLTMTLAACGETTDDPATTGTNASTGAVTEAETDPLQNALDAVLEEVDWGGKDFGILYVNEFGYTEEVEAEAAAGDDTSSGVINDAVWERNSLFEDYCKLTFVLIPVSNGAVTGRLQGEVQTGTGDFHLTTMTTSGTTGAATSGFLYNYLALDIDYEQEWWDAGTLDFVLDDRVFFMNGPFNIVDDDVTFVMMFNKKLREEYQIENPYTTVENGEWTLDKFNSIIGTLATENGDGKWDENDTYGFTAPGSIGNTFFYGADLQYVYNDRTMAEPELALVDADMEKALNVLSMARSIVHDGNSSYIAAQGQEVKSRDIFIDQRALYYVEAASYLRALNKEMEGEYGVIPIPKYDKKQEKYTTWSHSIGSTLSIPTSVASGDLDAFADVLEVYCLLSQKLVRPAYYDTMLTTRNVHDVESSEMLDLIFLNRIYDMAMYFDTLGFSPIFSDSVVGADSFASRYASVSKGFDKKIASILRNLERNSSKYEN